MNERPELRTWLCAALALAACIAPAPRPALAQGAAGVAATSGKERARNERPELRTWLCAALALAACIALAPRTALAQGAGRAPDQGPRAAVRAYYLWDSFSSSESALGVDTFSTVSFHGKPGGGIDAEYLFTPWMGLDFGASQTHVEADEVTRLPVGPSFQSQGKIQQRFFTLGLYGHFYRVQRVDVYIGPLVGADEMTGSFRPNKTTFAFGAALGLDLPLGAP